MIVQYLQFLPIFKGHILLYKAFILFIIIMIYSTFLILITMAFRIKYRKVYHYWIIDILKYTLPIISYFFFGQIFIVLTSVFYCRKEESYESPYLHCLEGIWIYSMKPAAILALILQIIIGFVTNTLYYIQYFEKKSSDLFKKIDTFPDVVFMITKMAIMLLFISDEGKESEHWAILLFLVFITGLNAYSNLFFRNRKNEILRNLNKTFSSVTFLAYSNLLIGKIFLFFHFNGLVFLFICDIILFIIYFSFYNIDDFNQINVNFQSLNNANDMLNYIFAYNSIISNFNKRRKSFFVFISMMTKIEEKCNNIECPLKKYLLNLSKGIEYKYLLVQYCDKLFQHGLSKFQDDINLKYHYTIFLIMQMNNKKKACILLNSLKYKLISFKSNYDFYRCQHLINNYNFQVQKKNFIIFKYRSNVINLKELISKVILYQYEFLTFIYGSKTKRDDNFKRIYELGSKILNYTKEIDEIFNELIIEKTNNIEIINLYSDFVEKILEDEEKLKKCQEMKKIIFNSNFHFYEKDFSNFDMRFLKDKDNYSFMVISAHHKTLGLIKDCSKNLVNIFGYQKKELVHQHINILIPEMFHDKHDLILKKTSENQKLNFYENAFKKKVYNPIFMERFVYGLSKAKFLIPIKLFIYLISTEENELVYIVEILRKIPLMNEIINDKFICCVLTNENFIIQSFTPNCMNYMKLKDNHISNYDIINNIKEFHEDYVIDINTTHLSKICTMKESSIINQKKYKNNLYMSNVKRSIKTDILNKYYSKKCRITWLINKKKKKFRSKFEERRSSWYNNSFKNIIDKNEEVEVEIELNMEIKKIVLENELLGYYFLFEKVLSSHRIDNNMVKFIDSDRNSNVLHLKLSGVQNISRKNQPRYSELEKINQTQILADRISFVRESDKKLRRKSCAEYNHEELLIGADFICKSPCNFIFDLRSLNYIYSNNRNNNKNIDDTLKKDVIAKIKKNQFQYNSLKNRTKILSKRNIKKHSSTEVIPNSSSVSNSNSNMTSNTYTEETPEESSESSSDSNTGTNSNSNSKKNSEKSIENKKDSIKNKNNFKLGLVKRDSKNIITEIKKSGIGFNKNLNIDSNNYLKILNKKTVEKENNEFDNSMEFVKSYFKVDMNIMKNVHFLVFDFYKEIFVEKKDFQRFSKVDSVIMDIKKNKISSFGDDEKYPHFVFENHNIMKDDEFEKKINEKKKEERKLRTMNEEKTLEKKIKYAISNEKDEPPIIKIKLYSITFLLILMILMIIYYIYYIRNYSSIKKILALIKNVVKLKYCNRMAVFYVGESTLLNFNADKIKGGVFDNFPDKKENKNKYIQLMRDKIKETFLESELCFEEILSTKISFSKNTTKFLQEKLFETHYINNDGKIESLISDIFTTLMQYNGAFYNLAFSPLSLEQNHTDILNFLHNSFNDYAIGINILLSTYIEEIDSISKSIYLFLIISLILFLLIYIANYIIIIHYYIAGNDKRTSYLEVFYELNENVLKILITNCESLFKKVKQSEAKGEEDESSEENLDKKVYFTFKKKQTKRNSIIFRKNANLKKLKKPHQKLPKHIRYFMKTFGFCLLITFFYFIYNAISCIKLAENAKYISQYLDRSQHFQTILIELFVVYRQYIFDDSITIYNIMPFDYLSKTLINTFNTISSDIIFMKDFSKKYLSKGEIHQLLTESFCNYNFTGRYNTYEECEDELFFLLNKDFTLIASNFLESLRKNRYILKYLLSTGKIVGGLNDYNQDLWLMDERTPLIGKNNTGNYIFRLDLYNDDTVHAYLDLIFVNILLPYIDINRKYVIPFISLDGSDYFLRLTTVFYVLIVFAVFCIYLLLEIKFLNKHIYRTKNLLRLIPLNILMSLGNIKSLLDLN